MTERVGTKLGRFALSWGQLHLITVGDWMLAALLSTALVALLAYELELGWFGVLFPGVPVWCCLCAAGVGSAMYFRGRRSGP